MVSSFIHVMENGRIYLFFTAEYYYPVCCSVTKSRLTLQPCGLQHSRPPWSLLRLMSVESVMPSNHLALCYPLVLLPSIFHSIRVFSSESALPIRWPKYWSFSISPSQTVNSLPAMETQVRSLGQEDPWRREWQHTPVFLPGEFCGQRSLAGYCPCVCDWVIIHFTYA